MDLWHIAIQIKLLTVVLICRLWMICNNCIKTTERKLAVLTTQVVTMRMVAGTVVVSGHWSLNPATMVTTV